MESRPYLLNIEASGFYRVAYEEENWRALINSLKTLKDIHRLNRAQLIDDIMNLARTNHASYELALDLLLYLRLEDDFIPWEAAFRSLSFLHYRMEDSKWGTFFPYFFFFKTFCLYSVLVVFFSLIIPIHCVKNLIFLAYPRPQMEILKKISLFFIGYITKNYINT